MQQIINMFTSLSGSEYIISFSVFILSATSFYLVYLLLWPRVEIYRRASTAGNEAGAQLEEFLQAAAGIASSREFGPEAAKLQEAIEVFYNSLQSGKDNALAKRLIRAGYFSKSALYYYHAIRIFIAVAIFSGAFILGPMIFEDVELAAVGYVAVSLALLSFVSSNIVLDRFGKKQLEQYRRAFPDFMDMLIVCADAGMSLEAAVARVSREMLKTKREFGIHLNILVLEVRAGKRLREALTSFGERLELEEAKSLATVFKQSEELGSSLTETLRVFSDEMRKARIVRAEEKANKLPVKMVFPLGVFIFPVLLMMICVPVFLTIFQFLGKNTQGL